MTDELLTVKEVAARLKLNPQTVRRWIRSGRLHGQKISARGWRIKSEEMALTRLTRVHPDPEELRRRQVLMEEFLSLREQLRGCGVTGAELAREARRDLEARGDHRGD